MLSAFRRPLFTITRSLSTVTSLPAPLSHLTTTTVPSTPPSSAVLPTFNAHAPPPVLDIPPVEDPLLQFMTNTIMRHGKRKRASRTVSRMLLWVHSLTRAPPLEIVREAVLLAAPAVRTMSHTHGGKIIARPIALSEKQRTRYALKWILKACDNRPGQTLEERLAREIISIVQGTSSVLLEKERAHTFATVNRCVFCGFTLSMPCPSSFAPEGTRGCEFNVYLSAGFALCFHRNWAWVSTALEKRAERILVQTLLLP